MTGATEELTLDIDHFSEKDQQRILDRTLQFQQTQLIRNEIMELNEFCFKKCFAGTKIKAYAEKADSVCILNCTERFFDASEVLLKSLQDQNS